ncbi:Ger(x)C family spore germination protein [Metabacillus fastidiosus]|uniref:Ger(x)C family spore germination protein n=1 Tax=Metabacillus fastidiosus TaxID=1458 RepID=UPI00082692E3|nr:Ger(x)C family spore germination protein [Metabacillus fastidiosus]MED4462369.1 Ger(x)C family spore germination protein [Metabacillus fastidiosus]
MKRKIVIFAIFIILLVLLTGCWNRRELNELAIAVGLGIDRQGDQYLVTVQIVNPGEIAAQKGGGRATPVLIYQETGDTVMEAFRRLTTVAPRKIYTAHLRMVVIGEKLAEEGFAETLDLLSRAREMRTDYYIAVAKDSKAENVLKILTSLEDIPASQLFSALETSEKAWAPTASVTLDELIPNIVSKGKEASLTGIKIRGDVQEGETSENVKQIEAPTKLQYEGIAVFKNDRLIGWLDEEESKGLNYSLGKVKSTIVDITCPNEGKIGIEIIRTKADVKTKVKNGRLTGMIRVEAEGNIADVECEKAELAKTETIREFEKKGEENIKVQIEAVINASQQKYKADVIGFGEALQRSNPVYWKKNEKEWSEKFTGIPIEIETDLKIRRVGTIVDPPLKEINQ